jgi:anoctamin-10
MFAFLIALAASHGYIILQVVVRHLVQRAIWLESKEVREKEKMDQAVKESYFRSLGGGGEGVGSGSGSDKLGKDEESFWGFEEGLAEIQKLDKDE